MKNESLKQISVPVASVRKHATHASELETQCLLGEKVSVNLRKKNWSLCKTISDSYIGWIENKSICDANYTSHKIINLITHIYKKPELKSQIIEKLYFDSKVLINEYNSTWSQIDYNNKKYYI